MTRTKIRLETNKEVTAFVSQLNADGSIDKYIVEDTEGRHRVNARSYLGMLYASAEFAGNMFLVNETAVASVLACVDWLWLYAILPLSP